MMPCVASVSNSAHSDGVKTVLVIIRHRITIRLRKCYATFNIIAAALTTKKASTDTDWLTYIPFDFISSSTNHKIKPKQINCNLQCKQFMQFNISLRSLRMLKSAKERLHFASTSLSCTPLIISTKIIIILHLNIKRKYIFRSLIAKRIILYL